jgi:SAM-dependent methyltransferase
MTPDRPPAGVTRSPGRDALAGADLVIVSFLLLFLELTVIRWLPATIRLIAYFSNVVLVSCFLGMGVGCIVQSRRRLLPTVAPLLLALVVIAGPLGRAGVIYPFQTHEFIFGPSGRLSWLWVIPLVFSVNALVFVGIGQRLAREMASFRPLVGYSLNVAGSLAGSVLFTIVATLHLPPAAWFAACAAALLWLLRRERGALAVASGCLVAALVLVYQGGRGVLWSPYYKIALDKLSPADGVGVRLTVNDDSHQLILDLSPDTVTTSPPARAWQDSYGVPYRVRKLAAPCRILVLGAGTGNDVAAALRETNCRVDAVELDPVIADLGRRLHPERPYADPRVRLFVTDARSFLATARNAYDLVVLGWLDSHRLFSSLSNVRQDNFVYTAEAMQRARDLLVRDGGIVLSFYVGKPWVGDKLYAMLYRATGRQPSVFAQRAGGYGLYGHIFVAVPDPVTPVPEELPGFANLTSLYAGANAAAVPTDDWPYLYYRDRTLSGEYLIALAMLLLISAAIVLPLQGKRSLGAREVAHFFLLGAGFLLLEVRNITTLALVFGSTWLVSSIVISAVLLMILAANALVTRGVGGSRRTLLWLLLIASILLSLAGGRVAASAIAPGLKAILATASVSATFLVAGLLFARAFARTTAPGAALGFNVLGAVAGGLAEYVSVLVGVDGLALVALSIYLLAWATAPRDPR